MDFDTYNPDTMPQETEDLTSGEVAHSRPGMFQTGAYRSVLVFCALYFFRPEDFWTPLAVIPLAKIAGVITAIALICALILEGAKLGRESKVLLVLLAYLTVCIPFSRWPGGSIDTVFTVFAKAVVIAVAVMTCVTKTTQLRRLMVLQVFAMLVMAAMAATQPKLQGRMYGTGNLFADPNDFALNLCIVLAFAVALLVSSRTALRKLFWGGTIAFLVAAIVMTGSRGGFLALVATAFALWRRFRVSKVAGVAILVFLVIFGVFAVLVIGGTSYVDRVETITNMQADATGSAQARWELLTLSLEMSVKHPIFGIGPGQFENFSGSWHLTHNTYTEFSSEAGLPSLILFLWLLWLTFKNLKVRTGDVKLRMLTDGLYGSMFGYVVGAFFLSTGYLFVPYLLMAYIAASARIAQAAESEPAAEAPETLEDDQVDLRPWEEPQHEH